MGIRVKEIMDRNPIIVDQNQTIFGLREIVILRQPECVLVTDSEKRLVGIMTPTHLATIADVDIEEKVTAVMERQFRRVNANMSVREAAALLSAS
ncbi:MAG: CBS domain-containing protein, partial [Erysipelotrichia bacterium]|nr:CBS domain-containing protein [Erysipelotrichia bacterium]